MTRYGLAFCPTLLTYSPPLEQEFIAELQKEGFIGETFNAHQQNGYLIGDHFLKLITFLGCSPHIEVSPPAQLSDWHKFCYVEIQSFDTPQYFKGVNTPKCSCPHCRARVSQVLSELESWAPGQQALVCPKCQENSPVENLNWRHGAGFGRFFLIVNSIYPNEAVPADRLMNLLADSTRQPWDYFYFERDAINE